MCLFDQLHLDWQGALRGYKKDFDAIESALKGEDIAPEYSYVMRALTVPIDSIRVVIFGQDPYPTRGHAQGLAFSVASDVLPIPASLANIFKELKDDCGVEVGKNGDLARWADQGVMLLNRVLTTRVNQSLAHENIGWQVITDEVAKVLGARGVIAIMWGKKAQELILYFNKGSVIQSPHPSPLSAYRGFFGSRPFSRVNDFLVEKGFKKIDW